MNRLSINFAVVLLSAIVQIGSSLTHEANSPDVDLRFSPKGKEDYISSRLFEKKIDSHFREKRCIVVQKQSGTHGDSNEGDGDAEDEYPDYNVKRKPTIKSAQPKEGSRGALKPKKISSVEVQDDSYDALDYPVILGRSRTQKYSSNGNRPRKSTRRRPSRNRKAQRRPIEHNEDASNDTASKHNGFATPS